MQFQGDFTQVWTDMKQSMQEQIKSRSVRVSNKMRTSAMEVLRGQGSGRIYRVPMTKRYYQASAPGEVPANRTGIYRQSWKPDAGINQAQGGGFSVISTIKNEYQVDNGHYLTEILEYGTSRMAPRPHYQKILDDVEEKAVRIYKEPYF